jgi:carotenoid cleavage dioxygenase-like enzyme
MIQHAKKTFALHEADFPFHVKVSETGKDFEIKSIGHDDFDGQLKHNVSAHPKVDAKTGTLYVFGYGLSGPYLSFSVIDKDRHMILSN